MWRKLMAVRRRLFTRTIGILAAALAIVIVAMLPPAQRLTPSNPAIATVTARGAFHIDGSGLKIGTRRKITDASGRLWRLGSESNRRRRL